MGTRTRLGCLVSLLLVPASSAAAQDVYTGMRLRSERSTKDTLSRIAVTAFRPEIRALPARTLAYLREEASERGARVAVLGQHPTLASVRAKVVGHGKAAVRAAARRVWERRSSWRLRLLKQTNAAGAAARLLDSGRGWILRTSGGALRRSGSGALVQSLDKARLHFLGARPYAGKPLGLSHLSRRLNAYLSLGGALGELGYRAVHGTLSVRVGLRAGARIVCLVAGLALGGQAWIGVLAGEALGYWAEKWYDQHVSRAQQTAIARRVYEAYGLQ